MNDHPPPIMRAFTLVELLVVVTIIVILIALLVPSMDKAITLAMKTKCLTNTRTVAQNCLTYAQDNETALPAYMIDGNNSSAYDMRGFTDLSKPRSTGLLVGKYLPANNQLGKVVHCPVMDNPITHCMDVDQRASGWVGGGYWEVPGVRVIAGYNYRAASYFNQTRADSAGKAKPKGVLKSGVINSSFLIYIDVPDTRFGSTLYCHPDGYNRAFGDGSGGFFVDTDSFIYNYVEANTAGYGYIDGLSYPNVEEYIYEYMSTRSVAEKP